MNGKGGERGFSTFRTTTLANLIVVPGDRDKRLNLCGFPLTSRTKPPIPLDWSMKLNDSIKFCARRKTFRADRKINFVAELIRHVKRTEATLTVGQLQRLTINPILALIPPAGQEQRLILEGSREKYGVLHPILVDRKKNEILDGRERVAMAIATKQPLKALLLDVDETEKTEIVLAVNLGRRQLTESQLAIIGAQLVHRDGKLSNRQAGKVVGVSHTYVDFALKILDDPELLTAVRKNELPLTGAIRQLREKQGRECRRQSAEGNPSKLVEIRHGDFFRALSDIPAGTIQLIVTDPMYHMAAEFDWQRLGEFANDKLQIGGSMFVMVGNATSIATGTAILKGGSSLKQHWTYGAVYTGPTTSYPNRHVINCFRDVYWFVRIGKGVSHPLFVESVGMDLLKLNGADTTYSEFGQKPESFEELIKRYSRPGDLVVDPFCGGGAVPEACQRHGRRCLASELDVSTFEGLVSRFFGCAPEKVRNSGKTKWGCVAAARTVPSTK